MARQRQLTIFGTFALLAATLIVWRFGGIPTSPIEIIVAAVGIAVLIVLALVTVRIADPGQRRLARIFIGAAAVLLIAWAFLFVPIVRVVRGPQI